MAWYARQARSTASRPSVTHSSRICATLASRSGTVTSPGEVFRPQTMAGILPDEVKLGFGLQSEPGIRSEPGQVQSCLGQFNCADPPVGCAHLERAQCHTEGAQMDRGRKVHQLWSTTAAMLSFLNDTEPVIEQCQFRVVSEMMQQIYKCALFVREYC
ncbi:hypothetical protein BV22DRAFT_910180 [Leucogyrophana mollusca]|uniref:Uncharacterized protein n=1 Tax=Leucogyrophana mollusca TaxID=85980 RepID=A0ACB8B0I9_9AGAM|nr:hypothetical protein BV22DRAFT_910180 [Leucogyrophana mollusca]